MEVGRKKLVSSYIQLTSFMHVPHTVRPRLCFIVTVLHYRVSEMCTPTKAFHL